MSADASAGGSPLDAAAALAPATLRRQIARARRAQVGLVSSYLRTMSDVRRLPHDAERVLKAAVVRVGAGNGARAVDAPVPEPRSGR